MYFLPLKQPHTQSYIVRSPHYIKEKFIRDDTENSYLFWRMVVVSNLDFLVTLASLELINIKK